MRFTFTLDLYVKILALAIVVSIPGCTAWGSSDKVKLKDVEVLTLYHGRTTAGRRSHGVPHLKCMGGSAGCSAFTPQVVQCYNRGWDGMDVQWECKTDMDNAFRFGKIQVSCEGYDYPDDPYILKGSCGLEYTLDLTKEGMNQYGSSNHDYYGGGGGGGGYSHDSYNSYNPSFFASKKQGLSLGSILFGVGLLVIVYAIYQTCIRQQRMYQTSSTSGDYPDSRGQQPPPPGFRPNYYPGSGPNSGSGFFDSNDSCSGGAGTHGTGTGGTGNRGTGFGGFWGGAATGGLLGYMFGRNNNGTGTAYHRPSYGWGGPSTSSSGYSSWGGSSSSRSGSSSSSTGTRTASGFGGTSRR